MKIGYGAVLPALAAILLIGGGFYLTQGDPPSDAGPASDPTGTTALPDGFVMPTLDGAAAAGAADFAENCAACHGPAATGTQNGPPLVHKIYEPSHHGDAAFIAAATLGTRQHHWPFGDMPPVEGITRGEIDRIIVYVRTLQRANGIE